ncbi:MAG: [citrate (pro-3S)-lyase] ligase [Streptococcaceae bacterium]|jgi:[citrate (pro-3S)-lyase] ligase|nr:[citrate (pro-3S)-lyase] ligase [Streptococcaceae bacterium]
MEKIQDILLKIPSMRKQWQDFLRAFHLRPPDDLSQLDETVGIYDEVTGELLACGSLKANVIQLVATCREEQVSSRFNAILTELGRRLALREIYHSFVFTKPEYRQSFEYLGFHELVRTDRAVLLEKGKPDIQDFLINFDLPEKTKGKSIASIVMNANPFTLGHLSLVKKAVAENDLVYVFVLAADGSLFSPIERLELVRKACVDLDNVMVSSGGDYMVSFATFPSYFIPDEAEIVRYQTELDAKLFGRWIVPNLGITSRYLGEEPFSPTTEIYNKTLLQELGTQIEVKIVPREKTAKGEIISATQVRLAIKAGNIPDIKEFLPSTTYAFILENLENLREREVKKNYRKK